MTHRNELGMCQISLISFDNLPAWFLMIFKTKTMLSTKFRWMVQKQKVWDNKIHCWWMLVYSKLISISYDDETLVVSSTKLWVYMIVSYTSLQDFKIHSVQN